MGIKRKQKGTKHTHVTAACSSAPPSSARLLSTTPLSRRCPCLFPLLSPFDCCVCLRLCWRCRRSQYRCPFRHRPRRHRPRLRCQPSDGTVVRGGTAVRPTSVQSSACTVIIVAAVIHRVLICTTVVRTAVMMDRCFVVGA